MTEQRDFLPVLADQSKPFKQKICDQGHYTIAGMRVAMHDGSNPRSPNKLIEAQLRLNQNWCPSQFWSASDHLSSVLLVINANGTAQPRYLI
ncbi:MAG: hypothetical protein ABFS17_08285 [Chloroflexota bacterium]